jgi:uncharacterized protein (TIGR02271 family)
VNKPIEHALNKPRTVKTREGLFGMAEPLSGSSDRVVVTLEDGRSLVVPDSLLEAQADGSFLLNVFAGGIGAPGREDYAVIPVMREELAIGTRMVETGRGVRITKHVTERQEEVVQLLYREQLDVEHLPRNQLVDAPPPVRYEGATMVVPLCEEVLVIEKRLLLKEEVRVTRRESRVRHAEQVTLRTEHARVERFGDEDAPPTPPQSTKREPITR